MSENKPDESTASPREEPAAVSATTASADAPERTPERHTATTGRSDRRQASAVRFAGPTRPRTEMT